MGRRAYREAVTAAIVATGLTKRYGAHPGLEQLDLTVEQGEVFGYLGPNGAGKTTTVRLLLDLIRPTAGGAQLFGLDVRRSSLAIRRRVGYLPGELALYERLTGDELVTYFAHLRGGVDRRRIVALAERLDVDLTRPIRSLSKGNKQKVGLVQCFMHEPDLLLLDEPTAGLDPFVQVVVHELIDEARVAGRTVFLSSHVLSEVERVAGRVGIIKGGRLIAVEDVAGLKERASHRVEARFADAVPVDAFTGLPGVRVLDAGERHVRLTVTGSPDAVVKELARHQLEDLSVREPDLEEIFLAYYGEAVGDVG